MIIRVNPSDRIIQSYYYLFYGIQGRILYGTVCGKLLIQFPISEVVSKLQIPNNLQDMMIMLEGHPNGSMAHDHISPGIICYMICYS